MNTNILDLDWEDLIETMPATEEAIAAAKRRASAIFDADEAPTRKLTCTPDSHENEGR